MKINVVNNYTLQLYNNHRLPKSNEIVESPSLADWAKMDSWCVENGIECRRGRGTSLIFERDEDVTAFMLRWV